jgi:hypothetical protein
MRDNIRPPYFAKFICLLTWLSSGMTLLRNLRVVPMRASMLNAYSERPILLPVLEVVKAIIVIVAAFFLWKMSKLAPKLFLVEFGVSAVAAVYLTYISPSKTALYIRQHDNKAVIFALFLAFTLEIVRLSYAWWVTSDRHLQSGINPLPIEG